MWMCGQSAEQVGVAMAEEAAMCGCVNIMHDQRAHSSWRYRWTQDGRSSKNDDVSVGLDLSGPHRR